MLGETPIIWALLVALNWDGSAAKVAEFIERDTCIQFGARSEVFKFYDENVHAHGSAPFVCTPIPRAQASFDRLREAVE